jgi:lipid-binding SYLF domain-containing protein
MFRQSANDNLKPKKQRRSPMKKNGLKPHWLIFGFIFFIAGQGTSYAASAVEIDAKVNATLDTFYREVGSGKELVKKSRGILVFPSVVKAGIGIGGEHGEGALRINGRTVDYYSTTSASIGFQLGVQSKSIVLLFMTGDALSKFRNSEGWKVGVDGSVALIKVGAGGSVDSNNITDPIIGFVFGQKGLMYNLTLEGSKLTKIKK